MLLDYGILYKYINLSKYIINTYRKDIISFKINIY